MALAQAWRSAAEGTMPPIEQAKLWALREVLRKHGDDDNCWEWMAGRVKVVGQQTEEILQTCAKWKKPCNDASYRLALYPGRRMFCSPWRPRKFRGAACTAIDRNEQRPQHLVEELPGGRDCTSSGSCLVVACRVGRCSWWCLGRLVRPAGASHGTCSWCCLGRTSVLPVPHTERLVSGGASDGLAKICRCLTRINAHVLFRCCRRHTSVAG